MKNGECGTDWISLARALPPYHKTSSDVPDDAHLWVALIEAYALYYGSRAAQFSSFSKKFQEQKGASILKNFLLKNTRRH